jgi:peptidoglycan/LPS O-acetylase OafA/YrhL
MRGGQDPGSLTEPGTAGGAARATGDAPPSGARTVDGRIAPVDGLRAIAVAGVIAFHFGLGVPGGFLGVDLFFVISGYVITRLLLGEWHRTGTIGRARFWGRRARRLLPAVMAVLVVVQVWTRLGGVPELRTMTDTQTVMALAYVSNWYAIFAGTGYWGALTSGAPLTHLWSLAVEEQFYLVWPLVLIAVLVTTRSRRLLAVVAGVGAVASYLGCGTLYALEGPDRAYLGTDARSGPLLLGALCALALTRPAPDTYGSWDRRLRRLPVARAGFVLAVAALAVLWATAAVGSAWLYEGGLAVAGVSAAAVIAFLVGAPGSVPARLLGSRPVVWLGRLSYSLYLWHWPVHVYAAHAWTRLGHPLLVTAELAVTLMLSVASFALVEQPARRLRPVALAAPLLACGLLVLTSAAATRPAPPAEQRTGVVVHGRP